MQRDNIEKSTLSGKIGMIKKPHYFKGGVHICKLADGNLTWEN